MNKDHLDKLKEAVQNLHLDNVYGTLQVAYGCKQSKGQFTEEKCIRFGVEKKVPLDQIPEDKRIPSTITVDGVEYKTDVYVAPAKIFTYGAMRKIEAEETNAAISPMTLAACNNYGDSAVPPNVSPPVSYNRATTRPLRGGVSMCHPPPTGYVNAGTLGAIVVDDFDGKMVGLTNNHVCSPPGGALGGTCRFFANDTNYAAEYSKYNNINIYQQSSWDSGLVNKSSDKIGVTKRVFPLSSTGINYVDCGIVNLTASIVDINSWDIVGATFGGTSPPFASTAEIDAITTSTPIFKSGRTTGPIGPDTYSSCVIQVTNTSVSLYVGGYADDNLDNVLFADCISIESSSTIVGLGGDSGSIMYAKIGGVWKIIGLYFAGDNIGSYGLACRIDRVSKLLHVSPYTGGTVDANPNTPIYTTLDLATYGSQASASIGGKTYWQVGKV